MDRSGVTIGVVNLQPRSLGTVRLASADPMAAPIVDNAYLRGRTMAPSVFIGHRAAQLIAEGRTA